MIGWIISKFRADKKPIRHRFTDEDRQFSLEIRQKNHDIKMKKLELEEKELEAELMDLDEELGISSGNSPEDLFNNMIMQAMGKLQGQTTLNQVEQVQAQAQNKINLPDEKIDEILKQVPAMYMKVMKKLPEEALEQEIRNRYPQIDDDTITRAIKKIKN